MYFHFTESNLQDIYLHSILSRFDFLDLLFCAGPSQRPVLDTKEDKIFLEPKNFHYKTIHLKKELRG